MELLLLLTNITVHGLICAIIFTAFLLFVMITFSPRIWAYNDYPQEIKENIPPQTRREKKIATILVIPFLFLLAFPFISSLVLKNQLGGEISLLTAFLNTFGVVMFANFADLIILDWLIVGTITPQFVILPGTEHMKDKEYKGFRRSHAKGHILVGTPAMVLFSVIIAVIVVII